MKKLVLFSILSCLLMLGVNFAAEPSFSLSISSGQELKLRCNYNIDVQLSGGGQNYNAFASTIKFDSGVALLTHKTVNTPFVDNIAGFVASGMLYRAYGALPGGQSSSLDVGAATFGFKTISNITGTLLQFTDYLGSPVVFGFATTADGITINGYDVAGADILTGVYNASYSFVPLPCVVDSNAPKFPMTFPSNGSRFISSGARASMLIYDWIGSNSVSGPSPLSNNSTRHYRYSGLDTSVLANYQASPTSVDNQQGVNSGSIVVTVSCPLCTSFGGPYVLSGTDLNITTWIGDGTRHRYTWDSQDRGYDLWFDPPAPYEIERQVTFSTQAVDNPNENGAIHTGSNAVYFNAPLIPVITPIYPTNGAEFIGTSSGVMLQFIFADDRAGIDTGTISITIPEIAGALTGYTYSGSDLQVILTGGSEGLGNSGTYVVQFYPKRDFPSNTGITVTGVVQDLVGNTGYLNMSFTTRMSCADRGCDPIFQVITLTGDYAGIFDFPGELLIVTGVDLNAYSPYPYLTGYNGDILMCGVSYTGTILTGNRPIYDTNNNQINGSIYSGEDLYITGLNFTIEGNVIIIDS